MQLNCDKITKKICDDLGLNNISKKEKLRNRYVKSNPLLTKPAVIDPKKTIEFQKKKYKSAFAIKQTETLNNGVEESKSEP